MPIFKKIWHTIEGKTKVGGILHEVLPFKKTRSAIGSVISGVKKATPLPEVKDLAVRETVNEVDTKLGDLALEANNHDQIDSGELISKINEVRDVLDDGKMNDSPDDLKPGTKKLITQITSAIPLLTYIVYVIRTGNWSIDGFFQYIKLFFGL